MTFQPALSWPVLVPLFGAVAALWLRLAWKSSAGLPPGARAAALGLRVVALLGIGLLLANPGHWSALRESARRSLHVLVDHSASMATGDVEKQSRWQAAVVAAQALSAKAAQQGLEPKIHLFDRGAAEAAPDALRDLKPDGDGSDLLASLGSVLAASAAGGDQPSAVVVLSDGRQTVPGSIDEVALRARSRRFPIHALTLGSAQSTRDLAVTVGRRTLTAFPKQKIQVPVSLTAAGLGPQRPEVVLLNAEGKELARQRVELGGDGTAGVSFPLDTPEESAAYRVHVEAPPGDQIAANNNDQFHVRIIHAKTRIFIAEGAPYWDSKFLAQLLRLQPNLEVRSVYRINEDRYFRIHSGESTPTDKGEEIFPSTREALAGLDVIVLGRGAEHFLTPERCALLRDFVRDQGGAVLFSRGKSYATTLPGLEPLEPVVWGTPTSGAWRFRPGAEGESLGLFGEILPARDDAVWNTLPLLRDSQSIESIKPFTRVLAHGVAESGTGTLPLLMVRRFGQGVTALVNADGLWQWDFFPEAKKQGNMYHDFWPQLILWMVSYSEFLPGHDFALNATPSRLGPGEATVVRVAWRGTRQAPSPALQIIPPGEAPPRALQPANDPTQPRPTWRSTFRPDAPGVWTIRLAPPGHPVLESRLTVLPPPGETDNLSSDPDFLNRLCAAAGGRVCPDLPSLLEAVRPSPEQERDAGAVWQPAWNRWWLAPMFALVLAGDWFLRRRHGLL